MALSNRQRKLQRKQIVKGSSRAGRPKKQVDPSLRYDSNGRLKPPAPNPRVVAERQAAMGDPNAKGHSLRVAENALDLAKHFGWLTPQQHQLAEDFADLYRKAGVNLPMLKVQDLARVAKGHSGKLGSAEAMDRLMKCAKKLEYWPKSRKALFSIAVLRQWPKWMELRRQGLKEPAYEVEFHNLVFALRLVSEAFDDRSPRQFALEKAA